MIFTEKQLLKIDRLRRIGRTYQEIAKLLQTRKASVIAQHHAHTGDPLYRKPSERFTRDLMNIKWKIPEGYKWKRKSLSYQKVGSMRKTVYPGWRWQYWVIAQFRLKSGTLIESQGYSKVMQKPDQPLMREQAINDARNRLGQSATFVRLTAQRYIQWKPTKKRIAPSKTHHPKGI